MTYHSLKRHALAMTAVTALVVAAGVAYAQSGHFIDNTVSCADIGTQCRCTGKVAGLGGTTFTITNTAPGTAKVECENPGGNVAPGQNTSVTAGGSSGPFPTPRNGQARFTVTTNEPTVPNTPTCPNAAWTAHVVDVTFGNATVNLFEDSTLSDTIEGVPCQ